MLPALSSPASGTALRPALEVSTPTIATDVVTGPAVASVTFTPTLAFFSFSVNGPPKQDRVGGVASRFTVTDLVVVPPPLVAVQVRVRPAVSALTVVGPQPVDDEITDCASVTVQVT